MSLSGLSIINCELTSHCNKTSCWMCSRRTALPDTIYGDMDFDLLISIKSQLPEGIVIQFHGNGEPLLYPLFAEAMSWFPKQIKCVTTNGKLLVARASEIISYVDTLSISVFDGDSEAQEQLDIVKEFLAIKKDRKPFTNIKIIGNVDGTPYKDLCIPLIYRQLHQENSSWIYSTKASVIPEIGICWDFLSHPCIRRNGDFSICVRYDLEGLGVLGNLYNSSLEDLWDGDKRREWLELHKQGKRGLIPLCSRCDYWGVPTT